MGKFPQSMYTDTETDNTSSSAENLKKKRKPSILKYTSASAKKKKCKIHSVSEPDESEYRARSSSRARNVQKKLQGILKHTGRDDRDRDEQKERYYSSSEDDDEPDFRSTLPPEKFLVGRVPPAGSKPGRGAGVALIVRKSVKADPSAHPKQTSSSGKKSSRSKRVTRKRSY